MLCYVMLCYVIIIIIFTSDTVKVNYNYFTLYKVSSLNLKIISIKKG